jgi:hypothetical protein
MKLSIGTNVFQENKRQTLALEILRKLKQKHDSVEIYNITFKNEKNVDGFKHLPVLERCCSDLVKNSIKKKPISKDLFNALAKTDCDYFLFLNSDIFLTDKCLKLIFEQKHDSYIFSRIDTYDINSLNDPIVPMRMEIAGFDAWCVKKDWWLANTDKFPDYIYGEPLWDLHYALTLYYNSNCFLGNKDVFIAHIKHPIQWSDNSIEQKYNANFWEKTTFHRVWHDYVYKILINRQPQGQFLQPLQNEDELEIKHLKNKLPI